MTVIGESVLRDLVEKYKVIYPTHDEGFDGDGYVLTVREDRTLNYLEHRNMISKEVIFTPPNYVAHLTAKSKFGRMGLSFLNSVKVHSGFVGRLALELVNLNNERRPITVNRGDPLIHIEFITREGEPSPYRGGYMFQYMDEKETDIYIGILTKHFQTLFTSEELQAKKKRVFRHIRRRSLRGWRLREETFGRSRRSISTADSHKSGSSGKASQSLPRCPNWSACAFSWQSAQRGGAFE